MVFLFQRVTDGCAMSNGCQCGTMVLVPHFRELCGDCPGKAGTLTPCQTRAESPWVRCHSMSPLHHSLPHRALEGLCTAGSTPTSVSGPRGGTDPPPGIPTVSNIASEKSAERVRGRQEEVWHCRAWWWEAIREQWGLGEEKETVLSFATVNLWCPWSQAGEPEALRGTAPAQPGRWLVHTSMKAAIKPPWSTHCKPNEVCGKGCCWKGLMLIKTLVLTCKLHLHQTQKILK